MKINPTQLFLTSMELILKEYSIGTTLDAECIIEYDGWTFKVIVGGEKGNIRIIRTEEICDWQNQDE